MRKYYTQQTFTELTNSVKLLKARLKSATDEHKKRRITYELNIAEYWLNIRRDEQKGKTITKKQLTERLNLMTKRPFDAIEFNEFCKRLKAYLLTK